MTGNPRLAWDSYRRLIQSYAEVVHSNNAKPFNNIVQHYLKEDGLRDIHEMDSVSLRKLCMEFEHLFSSETGERFPQDPWQQIYQSISAVFNSWLSKRAQTYRKLNNIDSTTGTACMIQVMVFGNAGRNSGSGVGFTRNPSDGVNEIYIDYLDNAQGEDIVSGRHKIQDAYTLQKKYPEIFKGLQNFKDRLEKEFSYMQDFEFTVQQGELCLLQTRNGKRTPMAGLRIAIDMVDEGIINKEHALKLVESIDLEKLFIYQLKQPLRKQPVATGIVASTGVTTGLIALDEKRCKDFSAKGNPVILVREETSTDDIGAMSHASGVITAIGGKTSHAAVVARQLGIVCIVGCELLHIDIKKRCITFGESVFREGESLTIDADHACIYAGQLDIEKKRPDDLLKRIEQWQADKPAQHTMVESPG